MIRSRLMLAAGALLVFGCQTTQEYAGTGPLDLASNTERHFQKYLDEENGYAFAVAIDGRSGSAYVFCKEFRCSSTPDRRWSAIQECEKSTGGIPCRLYAVRDKVVWNRNGPNLWDPADPSTNAKVPILTKAELLSYPHETERDWLSSNQHSQFRDYLKALERGSHPVGAFAIADDGQYYWSTHTRGGDGPNATAERSIKKCRERSKLPETCRIFAANNLLLVKEQRVTSKNYWSHVPRGKPIAADKTFVPTFAESGISPESLEAEQDWLTTVQLRLFGSYLRTLENGARPFGVFIVSDDGRAISKPSPAIPDAVTLAAEEALGRCRELSRLPDSCHVFAVNNRISSTSAVVTSENYRDHIEVRTGLIKYVAERERVVTLR